MKNGTPVGIEEKKNFVCSNQADETEALIQRFHSWDPI